MNRKLCAPADRARSWESIDWKKAEAYVKKLQMRIVKAQKDGHYSKVKTLQWLLTHSFYANALTICAEPVRLNGFWREILKGALTISVIAG